MYIPLVMVSALPAILIFCTSASPNLLVSGAVELAFAFYAFTSGNATYSLCPTLDCRRAREDGVKKAVNIIAAARIISVGATILIILGIVESTIPKEYLGVLAISAPILISYGAIKLHRNISFPVNDYIISRNSKDYPDRKK